MFACLPKLPKKNKLTCGKTKDIAQQVQQTTETRAHNEMPLVSVIVPCYNVEEYIDQCLTSILNNGYQNIELLVIDDRSTDSTVAHVKALMQKDSRIKLFHNPTNHNIYGGACRNIGLDHAKGKYIYFCDSDDYILPGLILQCVKKMESLDPDMCCFRHKRYDVLTGQCDECKWSLHKQYIKNKYKEVYGVEDIDQYFSFVCPEPWDKVFSRSFLKKNEIRFQEISNSNDVFFFIKAMTNARKITYIDEEFYVYRTNVKTSVQKNLKQGIKINDFIFAYDTSCRYIQETGNGQIKEQFYIWLISQIKYRSKLFPHRKDIACRLREMVKNRGFLREKIKWIFDKWFVEIEKHNQQSGLNILFFDLVPWHEEVCYGVVSYLEELGHNVTILLNEHYQGREVNSMISDKYDVMFIPAHEIIKYVLENYDKYDCVIWGTMGGKESIGKTWENNNVNQLICEQLINIKNLIGITHHFSTCPTNIKETIRKDRTLTILSLSGNPCEYIPLTDYGYKFSPNLFRKFNKKVMFASRGSPSSYGKTQQFIQFIGRNPELSGFMTWKKLPHEYHLSTNIKMYKYVKFKDMLTVANECCFIYMPIEYPENGRPEHASGSFQMSLALGLIPIFHVSGEPFGFPDDCCVTFKTEDELDKKMKEMDEFQYIKLRNNLITHADKVKCQAIKVLNNTISNVMEKKNDILHSTR